MNRVIARLPDSIPELCLVRLGLQVKSLSGWLFGAGYDRPSRPRPAAPSPRTADC